MKLDEFISTSPIQVEKSVRADEIRSLTSCKAGQIIPVSYIPILREDRVSRGQVKLAFDMAETIHPLMNSVNVTAFAHFVPFFAFERFNGSMDAFNRSYQGVGEPHNSTPIPFFKTINFDRNAAFWKSLGIHWKQGAPINDAPLEAYNLLVNWRRNARSARLPLKDMNSTALAVAFWKHSNLWHIVPDYDQAMLDGEVPLLYNGHGHLPLYSKANAPIDSGSSFRAPIGSNNFLPPQVTKDGTTLHDWGTQIFAEMKDAGVSVTLSNIELAKQMVSFAKLRQQYDGLDDDYIIDLLMEGIRVPDEALKQPILLDKKSTIFGYSERHAMDGANLDMSVTTGQTSLTLNFRTPPMNMGGIILITVEIVPEQLFERQRDVFLGTTSTDALPSFMRDYLDPEKVSVVRNDYVDVEHAAPTATFGYAPLNHEWKRSLTRIGGKYYRPNPDAFVEDRQRFWAVEQPNPTLGKDFYLATSVPHSVFMDTISDPFEVLALGRVEVVGNTVFGKTLDPDNDDYDAVRGQVDMTRHNVVSVA